LQGSFKLRAIKGHEFGCAIGAVVHGASGELHERVLEGGVAWGELVERDVMGGREVTDLGSIEPADGECRTVLSFVVFDLGTMGGEEVGKFPGTR
jgi:hypothetical protein